jgi:hypothetical protein
MSYVSNNFSETEIKRKIINILRTFRSLGLVTDSDVRINELEEKDGIFVIKGEYQYRSMHLNDIGERGTFNISLDKNMQPKSFKITPAQNNGE